LKRGILCLRPETEAHNTAHPRNENVGEGDLECPKKKKRKKKNPKRKKLSSKYNCNNNTVTRCLNRGEVGEEEGAGEDPEGEGTR